MADSQKDSETKDAYQTPKWPKSGSNFRKKPAPPSPLNVNSPSYSSPALDLKLVNSAGHHPLLPTGLLMGSPYPSGSPNTFAPPTFTPIPTYSPTMTMLPYTEHMQMSRMQYLPYQVPVMPEQGSRHLCTLPRTIYIGNLVPDVSWEEIFQVIRYGPIESSKYLSDKSCVFISFLDHATANAFYQDSLERKLIIRGQEAKTGWGRFSLIPTSILKAITSNNATRNVYLGALPDSITIESLQELMSKFGAIEKIDLVREKKIAFVHFISISMAVKAVEALQSDSEWVERRVSYGRDHCARISVPQQMQPMYQMGVGYNSQHQQLSGYDPQAQTQGYMNGYIHQGERNFPDIIQSELGNGAVYGIAPFNSPMIQQYDVIDPDSANNDNRTIYFGNLHPDTTLEEICNVVRGGMLQHVRYLPDRHIAFITFLYPASASFLYQHAILHGLVVHNRRIKVGWGKNTGPLPPAIQAAVNNGATRNVYIGNIDDSITESWLRSIFSQFGDIELVNTFREKSCAFVNFTSITAAIKAVEGVKSIEELKRFRVNFGKDRCGNPPRASMISSDNAFSGRRPQTEQHPNYKHGEDNLTVDTPSKIPKEYCASDGSVSISKSNNDVDEAPMNGIEEVNGKDLSSTLLGLAIEGS